MDWHWTYLLWYDAQYHLTHLSVILDQPPDYTVRLCWKYQPSVNSLPQLPVLYQTAKTRAVTVTLMFTVLLVGILKGVERPRSVYSTMPQWCHLTVLQAASFHLPSVSIANSNTVQYTKPYQQCEIATIPDLVISKMLLPQFSIIMAASVHSHSSLFFDVSSSLPKYKKYNITKFKFVFSPITSCTTPHTPAHMSNCQQRAAHFNLSMPQLNVVITLLNWITN